MEIAIDIATRLDRLEQKARNARSAWMMLRLNDRRALYEAGVLSIPVYSSRYVYSKKQVLLMVESARADIVQRVADKLV